MQVSRINEIENAIAENRLSAAQVFTQMKQLIPAFENTPTGDVKVMGNIKVEGTYGDITHYPVALLVSFDSTNEIRDALEGMRINLTNK